MGKEIKRELIQRHTEAECEKGFYVTFYCMLIYLLSPEFIYFGFLAVSALCTKAHR